MSNLTDFMLFSCRRKFLVQFGPPYSSCSSKSCVFTIKYLQWHKMRLITIIYCLTVMLQMLDDFVDVSKDEKQLMHLWNSFMRKQRCLMIAAIY